MTFLPSSGNVVLENVSIMCFASLSVPVKTGDALASSYISRFLTSDFLLVASMSRNIIQQIFNVYHISEIV